MSEQSYSQNIALVCAGFPVLGCDVRIGDRAGAPLPPDTVGHILIRGANVTRGYYRDAEATRAAISAEGWLDTGDLGFFSPDDGCGLVITGRFKDIIFVAGQNYYPQDIEGVLARHAGIELGRAAACGIRAARDKTAAADTDDVIVFVLHRGSLEDFLPIAAGAARMISEHIGIALTHVVPVNKMPKTTSGKIQRYLLGEYYAHGDYAEVLAQLAALAAAQTATPAAQGTDGDIARTLQEICDSFIAGKAVGVNDNIFDLGMSSLALAQIHQRVETLYPGKLEVTDFFDYPTIAELAKYLESRLKPA